MSQYLAHKRVYKKRMSEINVVPYIDVMLVLLVIFMVTAPLLSEGVKIKLPQAAANPLDTKQQEPVIVSVDAAGAFYLSIGEDPKQALEAGTMVARVAAVLRLRPGTNVLVRGDEEANYGKVITALALLQKAGVENVGLITRPPEVTRPRP